MGEPVWLKHDGNRRRDRRTPYSKGAPCRKSPDSSDRHRRDRAFPTATFRHPSPQNAIECKEP